MEKNEWIKSKMTVSLNKETISKLREFTEGLPTEVKIDSVTQLVVYLLETTGKPVNHEETTGLLKKIEELEADNHVLGHQLSDEMLKVSQLETKLKDAGKPVNQEHKPEGRPVTKIGKPVGKPVNQDGKPEGEPVNQESKPHDDSFKFWWE